MSALERDRNDKDRFSLRIWRSVCGGSSSSDSGGGAGGGGVPSAGTNKSPSERSGRVETGEGMINRAEDLTRGEDRMRWEKRRAATCVDVTLAELSTGVALGGDVRACKRGVIGGAERGPGQIHVSILHNKRKGRNYQCHPEEALLELSLA